MIIRWLSAFLLLVLANILLVLGWVGGDGDKDLERRASLIMGLLAGWVWLLGLHLALEGVQAE